MKVESSPKSTMRLLGIFDVVSSAPDGASLAKLSAALGSPKSSLLNMLRPLVAEEYLVYANGAYTLGPRIFHLASSILAQRKQPNLIRRFARELADATQETVIVAILDHASDLVAYADVIDSPKSIRYSVAAGVTRPMYCSAGGRLLLAFQSETWRESYLERIPLKPLTARTVTDAKELRAILQEIRRTGTSYSSSQAIEGAAGIAAPVFDSQGVVLAALLVAGPAERVEQNYAQLRRALVTAAARASQALGYGASAAVA